MKHYLLLFCYLLLQNSLYASNCKNNGEPFGTIADNLITEGALPTIHTPIRTMNDTDLAQKISAGSNHQILQIPKLDEETIKKIYHGMKTDAYHINGNLKNFNQDKRIIQELKSFILDLDKQASEQLPAAYQLKKIDIKINNTEKNDVSSFHRDGTQIRVIVTLDGKGTLIQAHDSQIIQPNNQQAVIITGKKFNGRESANLHAQPPMNGKDNRIFLMLTYAETP